MFLPAGGHIASDRASDRAGCPKTRRAPKFIILIVNIF